MELPFCVQKTNPGEDARGLLLQRVKPSLAQLRHPNLFLRG
jgi:hypothetical protein